jgi:hypothetical protein
MANYQLLDDSVDIIPIVGDTSGGTIVALDPAVVPTLKNNSNGDTAAEVTDAAGNPATTGPFFMKLNALFAADATTVNLSVEVDDGTLNPFVLAFDIVTDLKPASVGLDLTAVTHAAQPVPPAKPPAAAPGP